MPLGGARVSDLDATTFGEWLRRRRKGRGLTQAELARKVGCATITIQKIEADQRRPSKDMAAWLAEAFELGPSQRAHFLFLARAGRNLTAREQASLDRPSTNLPPALPTLVGRENDLATARRRVLDDGVRLLTIAGPPGVGKTTLSLHLGGALLDAFEDGAYFVALADAFDTRSVAAAIAQTLNVNHAGLDPRRLTDYLSGKQLLLVLDNYEQAVSSAPFVAELLRACPWLSVIVTSRVPLGIRFERRLVLGPLELPQDATACSPDEIARSPAVSLFIERAQAVNPEFVLTVENVSAVVQICTRLGGLPLAIELVAARAAVLTPQALQERLGGRLLLDSGGLQDVPDRHRTIRAAIDWSYALLSAVEQRLFARLGVCSGEFGLDVAEVLAPGVATDALAGGERAGALDALVSLVEKGLVVRRDRAGAPRFQLLEPIRDYALERLENDGEERAARLSHADYYSSLALDAEPRLRERGQVAWLDKLESAWGNLQAALAFLLGPVGDPERALQLANALFWFWNVRGHLSEGRFWLMKGLEAARDLEVSPQPRAKALAALAALEWQEGDLQTARTHIDESVELGRQLEQGPSSNQAMALCVLAMVAVFQRDEATAAAAAGASLRMFTDLGDRSGIALALNPVGKVRLQQRDLAAARCAFEQSLALFHELGDHWGAGIPLMNLGVLEAMNGRGAIARARLEESARLFEAVGERWMRATVLDVLASLLAADGETARATAARRESLDILTRMGLTLSRATVLLNFARVLQSHRAYDEALTLFEQSLELQLRERFPLGTARCLIGLAAAAVSSRDPRRAARLLGAAEHVLDSGGIVLASDDEAERDKVATEVRAIISQDIAHAEWQAGRTMGGQYSALLFDG
jgi:predicted ATPase/DNA-binding XRE family transcriptional regulator